MLYFSILGRFPGVSLNFADNASMHLRQKDYLVQEQSQGDTEVWCIGFRESTNQDTILGDLVLKDKLIVYDLERQRIGWANHDCSPYINATTTAPSSGVTSEPEILLKLLALLLLSLFSLGIMIKYEINLESVSVNGHTLPINQSILRQGRTIVDSGTTFAYLARGAFLHLLDAITKVAPDYAQPTIRNGIQCYMSNYSILGRFPGVSLNFADNASMHLRQQDYLVQQQSQGDTEVWCIGFRESTNQDTILGDLVLKDKLIVYDLERQRIGWANHDCSPYINATTTAPSSGVTSEPEILLKLLALLFVSSFSLGIM
ncbi:aspartic proteinase-like protein 2 [Artemisia annua]|uniref:Aspartic proteinase-like protein 2 n=1 Tax=Artemisia annua TaxID=35608 RepID=A0A2U1QN80_ARTAN|nr:aspartic proteinase-like protein 2 [Artemisia annua]